MPNAMWKNFLETQGATIDTRLYATFNHSATSIQHLLDLSPLGLIAVSGEEAITFLQGQFTNDIKQVKSQAQLTGYCTPKGRLLALFFAFQLNDTIYLQCPRELIPDLIKRLRMYVLRSKVIIEDASDHFVCLGLVADHFNTLPDMPGGMHMVNIKDASIFIRLAQSAGRQRGFMISPVEQAEQAWRMLASTFMPSNTNIWDLYEIQAGIPQVYLKTREEFVPQMINLDALQAINFKKGCYTGQEIVARTHYLGKIKRRSMIARIKCQDRVPEVGDQLLDSNQQEAGKLVRVAPATEGNWWLLFECRLETLENGVIFYGPEKLEIMQLPYTLPE